MGKYDFGFIKALYEQDLMPRIICGSSVGTLVGSYICGMKYEEVKNRVFVDASKIDFVKR